MSLDIAFKIVSDLAKDFRDNEKYYRSQSYQEADVRNDFINKFFTALGWDVRHDIQKNPYEQEVRVEKPVQVAKAQKRADYSFALAPDFRSVKFFVEAKKPAHDLLNKDYYFQTARYGWNANTPVAVLTDFEEFHIVDCRFRPNINDSLNYKIKQYHYSDYTNKEKFAEIYWLFSREAVADNSLEKYAEALPKPRGKAVQKGLFKGGYQSIDEAFLEELDEIRTALAKSFKKNNTHLSSEELTEATQRTIDRLVFIKFLEDKMIEPDHYVSEFGGRRSAWEDFLIDSRKLDAKYNGVVFKKSIVDSRNIIEPDDKTFSEICNELSHDNTPYNFDAIPIHILGSIYERFLGKVVNATDKRATIDEKPEVRKAGGVYYTPQYIVNYIVENTVGKMIEGKTPRQIAKLRFADIACGSGSFLITVFETLLDYYKKWYQQNPEQAKKDGCILYEGVYRLTLKQKQNILTSNIYGVDIDQQAVEVTQLSLYLKLLEDETTATANDTWVLFKEKLLPNLNKNIVCGNSLIGTDILDGKLFDFEEEKKIKPMDFENVFPQIFPSKVGGGLARQSTEGEDGPARRSPKDGDGFDAIVGNPPYLNIDDTWGKGDIRLKAIKDTYPQVYNDKTDILFYFITRALTLSKGYVSFIVSRAYLEAYKANKLRKFILENATIIEVIDFRNFYVFKKVGISTSIITLKQNENPKNINAYNMLLNVLPYNNLNLCLSEPTVFELCKTKQSSLSDESWSFTSQTTAVINAKIDSCAEPLGTILIIGQGMQTGRNAVFGNRSLDEIKKWGLKSGRYFKRASNTDIQKYAVRGRGEYILFLEDFTSLNSLPNGVRNYLLSYSEILKSRAAYKRGDCLWWKYTWPLNAKYYNRKRLLCPYLASSNRFAPDFNNEFLGLTDTTVLFDNNQLEDLLYILGLLNSRLLTFRFRSIGKLKSNGIYEYFWNSISHIPIRRINLSIEKDKISHDKIVHLVNQMLEAKNQLQQAKTEGDKDYLNRKCERLDKEIDQLVYQLYGLTEAEIKIVEGK